MKRGIHRQEDMSGFDATPLNLPVSESPAGTEARLRKLAEAEVAALVASGEAEAVGLTGSLSTGRLWPSSDLDMLIITSKPVENPYRWSVRDGTVIHGCVTPWEKGEALKDRYPASLIETTEDDYALDAVWALDGMVAMEVVHDPAGRLRAVRDFVAGKRFASEVVVPRRPRLLARARKERKALSEAVAANPVDEMKWHYKKPGDLLAVLWLEKAGRVVSHKEMDPALGEIGMATGRPGLRELFRTAEGVGHLAGWKEEIGGIFDEYLRLYSPALDALLAVYRGGHDPDGFAVAECVYLRHVVWSVRYALEKDCLLHLGSVRDMLGEYNPPLVPGFLGKCGTPLDETAAAALVAAHRRALDALAPGPWEPRAAALDELIALGEGISGRP